MNGTDPLHVVLGCSGGAGNAIARAAHQAGLGVRGVNRSGEADLPDGIEMVGADVATGDGLGQALEGAAVVYMAAQPPYHRWPEEFPPMLRTVIDASASAGAKLVMVDNLYSYGPGAGTISERTPERATDRKGRVRREMAGMLLEAHRSGVLRVAIGQASDYIGPRAATSAITSLAIEPAIRGATIRWVGRLDVPHSVAYLPDIGRAYTLLGTSEAADGRSWILPHPPAVTGQEFLDLVNRSLDDPVATGKLSPLMLTLASPFHRPSREIKEIVYQWTEPFVVDDSAFQEAFGPFPVTPIEEAVRTTVESYRQQGPNAGGR